MNWYIIFGILLCSSPLLALTVRMIIEDGFIVAAKVWGVVLLIVLPITVGALLIQLGGQQ